MFGLRLAPRWWHVSLRPRCPVPAPPIEPLERRRLLAGDFAWAGSFQPIPDLYAFDFSTAHAVATDPTGNVVTAGSFSGPVDFDPGAGVVTLDAGQTAGAFVTKLDTAGQLVWARTFPSNVETVSATSVAADAAGNVYVAGTVSGAGGTVDLDPGPGVAPLTLTGGYDAFVVKLDPAGNFVWARTFVPGFMPIPIFGVSASSVAVDSAGNVTLGGWFAGNIDLDPGPGNTTAYSAGGQDAFVIRLDPAGSLVWAKTFGSTGTEFIMSVATDAAGSAYITGVFTGTTDLDPSGTLPATSQGGYDVFVTKLSPTGALAWTETFGGVNSEVANTIAVDPAGQILVGGHFAGTADFDPGPGTLELTSAGSDDAFLLRLSGSGALVRALRLGGPGSDTIVDVDATRPEAVYVAGAFSDTIDFGPVAGQLTSAGLADAFVARLDAATDTVAWARAAGSSESDAANSVAADLLGNVYAAGAFSETADFDPGPAAFNLTAVDRQNAFVWKLLDPPSVVPTPHERIGHLLSRIDSLRSTALAKGHANGLRALLSSADRHLAAGRARPALNKLRAADHQLSAAIRSLKSRDPDYAGHLTALQSLRSALADLAASLT